MVFKLTQLNDEPKIKLSEEIEKVTRPGSKSILRFFSQSEDKEPKYVPLFDILCLEEEASDIILAANETKKVEVVTSLKEGELKEFEVARVEELSELVYEDGKVLSEAHNLKDSRELCKKEFQDFGGAPRLLAQDSEKDKENYPN